MQIEEECLKTLQNPYRRDYKLWTIPEDAEVGDEAFWHCISLYGFSYVTGKVLYDAQVVSHFLARTPRSSL